MEPHNEKLKLVSDKGDDRFGKIQETTSGCLTD